MPKPITPVLVAILAAAGHAQQWSFLDGPVLAGRMTTYDWNRGRLVAFGSEGTCWELLGTELLHRPFAGPVPPARSRGALAYDLTRGRLLMFGGLGSGNVMLGDTWTFDGTQWTQLVVGPQPPGRVDVPAVHDVVRDRVVLYGGQQLFIGQLSDTWEHDGMQWLQRTPATVPGPNSPVMSYDLLRGVTVMVTHAGLAGAPVTTWEWNGNDWAQRAVVGPAANGNEAMAFDLLRGRTVLFGGVGTTGEIWEWNGVQWQLFLVPAAPQRLDPGLAFDLATGTTRVIGGIDFQMSGSTVQQGSERSDVLAWNGTTLTTVHGDRRPPSRHSHLLAANPASGTVLLFGGMRQQVASDDTWTWNGNTWTEALPATRPSARHTAGATTDGVRTLLFGGNSNGTRRSDLWAFDGANWSMLDVGTGPTPRIAAGLAFDSLRNVLVLFGGTAASGNTNQIVNDTWEWNGSAWMQRFPASSPSPREGAAMAFDTGSGKVVLFGGRTGATAANQLADAYEWNSSNWQPFVASGAPPALLQPSLHHDAAAGVLWLTGSLVNGSAVSMHVWRCANGAWTQLGSDARYTVGGPTALDPVRRRLVGFKQYGLAEWSTSTASFTNYGSGCGNPVPPVMARTRPRIGDASFGFETRGGSSQPAVFGCALQSANVPIGAGCSLLLGGAAATVFAASNNAGYAEMRLPLPADTWLRGVNLYVQSAVLDAAAPLGFRVSQGLQVTLGD